MDVYLETADHINKDLSKLLQSVLSGEDKRFRYKNDFIRWGLVEKEMHKIVEYYLTNDA